MELYVGNLSYNTGEQEIEKLFATHGDIASVSIIRDRATGQSRGFGFVEMTNADEERLEQLSSEIKNFEDIATQLLPQPGEVPRLRGIDVWGGTFSLNGQVGGDHIIYVDFKQRFDLEARLREASEDGRGEVMENLRRCQRTAGIA